MDFGTKKNGILHLEGLTGILPNRRLRLSRSVAELILLTMLMVSLLTAFEREPLDVFKRRRVELTESVKDGIVVLFGGTAPRDIEYMPFRQANDFYYLTGSEEPDAALILVPPLLGGGSGREILFLPERDLAKERWDRSKDWSRPPQPSRGNWFFRGYVNWASSGANERSFRAFGEDLYGCLKKGRRIRYIVG